MKVFRIIMAIALLVVGAGFSFSGAKAGAFSSYDSSIQLQNLDNAAGQVTLYFYNQDGSIKATVGPDPLAANGQVVYFPLPSSVGTFNGSVVVSSTVNVASISNVRGDAGESTGSYIAQSSGATTVNLPILMKNNGAAQNSTWFNVQNVGLGDTNITVNYTDGTNANFNGLKKGAAHTFDQKLETHSLPAFAGTVTSSGGQPIVVTVIQETTQMLLASNGFTSGTTNLVAPLVNYQPSKGLITGLNIKNMSGSTQTNVTVTYKLSTGTCTETQTIPAGALKVFALLAFTPGTFPGVTTNCAKGAVSVGSAEVTTNSGGVQLAAIANQQKYAQSASAYGSFDKNLATGKFVAPLIHDRNGPYDLWSSVNMMNVGTNNTTITCTFTGVGYSYTSPNLIPGQGDVLLLLNKLADPYAGGGSCVANTPGAKIIAVVNQQGSRPNADQMGTYEAINVTP